MTPDDGSVGAARGCSVSLRSFFTFASQFSAPLLLLTFLLAFAFFFPPTENSVIPAQTLNAPSQTEDASELFEKLMQQRNSQTARLNQYSVVRTYELEDVKGRTLAKEVVVMEYEIPGSKNFRTVSASGSAFVRNHIFKQLMKREAKRSANHGDQESAVTPQNYRFETTGYEQIDGTSCIRVHATPKRKEPYLFDGTIWIADRDFAIVKVSGHLAKSPSFWIKRINFVRQYKKIEGFWLPMSERSTANVRIYGTKILVVDYRDYKVQSQKLSVDRRVVPKFVPEFWEGRPSPTLKIRTEAAQ